MTEDPSLKPFGSVIVKLPVKLIQRHPETSSSFKPRSKPPRSSTAFVRPDSTVARSGCTSSCRPRWCSSPRGSRCSGRDETDESGYGPKLHFDIFLTKRVISLLLLHGETLLQVKRFRKLVVRMVIQLPTSGNARNSCLSIRGLFYVFFPFRPR